MSNCPNCGSPLNEYGCCENCHTCSIPEPEPQEEQNNEPSRRLSDIQQEAFRRVDEGDSENCEPCDIAAAFSVSLNICRQAEKDGLDCSEFQNILENPEDHDLEEALASFRRLCDQAEGEIGQQLRFLKNLAEGKHSS